MNDHELHISNLLAVGNMKGIADYIGQYYEKLQGSGYEFVQILLGGNYESPSLEGEAKQSFSHNQ